MTGDCFSNDNVNDMLITDDYLSDLDCISLTWVKGLCCSCKGAVKHNVLIITLILLFKSSN